MQVALLASVKPSSFARAEPARALELLPVFAFVSVEEVGRTRLGVVILMAEAAAAWDHSFSDSLLDLLAFALAFPSSPSAVESPFLQGVLVQLGVETANLANHVESEDCGAERQQDRK